MFSFEETEQLPRVINSPHNPHASPTSEGRLLARIREFSHAEGTAALRRMSVVEQAIAASQSLVNMREGPFAPEAAIGCYSRNDIVRRRPECV